MISDDNIPTFPQVDAGLKVMSTVTEWQCREENGTWIVTLPFPFSHLGSGNIDALIALGWRYHWKTQTWRWSHEH